MAKHPWTPHVTVACVIERGGQFLMVEEEIDGRIVWNQPAGHLDPGESLVAAVRRETLEETGWTFTPCALVGVYRWAHADSGATYVRFVFTGELHDEPTRQRAALDADILGTRWATVEDLLATPERLRSPLVMRAVQDYLAGHRYPLTLLHELDVEAPDRSSRA